MKPLVLDWLTRHGLPPWLAPDYAVLVGIGTLLGIAHHLRRTRIDRGDIRTDAFALMLAYVAALVGGYALEWLRVVPEAIVSRSLAPFAMTGRAAYGGLLFGIAAPCVFLAWRRAAIGAFFDRAAVGTGIIFAFVRTGCFLEGCDYGMPSAGLLAVRFPPGSLAAVAHAQLGWVPAGAPSLPVHPTELYEAALGLLAAGVALACLRPGGREGGVFRAWLGTYAAGRFVIEFVRGDHERGAYLTLSSAQWISVLVLAWLAVYELRRVRHGALRPMIAAATLLATLAVARIARAEDPPRTSPSTCPPGYTSNGGACVPAQAPCPPGLVPTQQPGYAMPVCAPPTALACPAGYALVQGPNGAPTCQLVRAQVPVPTPAPVTPPSTTEPVGPIVAMQHGSRVSVRASFGAAVAFGRTTIPSGYGADVSGAYVLWLGPRLRFEAGLEGRVLRNAIANQWSLGLWLALGASIARRADVTFVIAPEHTWIAFDSPFFNATNAWGLRFEVGFQAAISRTVFLGGTPLAIGYMNSEAIGTAYTWEPRVWLGAAF